MAMSLAPFAIGWVPACWTRGDQLRIQKALDAAELKLGGIYHSHTRSAPYPSQTDISLALYPDAVYIIVGLAPGAQADVHGYRIVDGQVREEPLVVRQ